MSTEASDVQDRDTATKRSDLLVLVCGIPGCGKDTIGRACVTSFKDAAAVSQDEHGGDATQTRCAIEQLLSARKSPVFVLRNGTDAADRAPYIEAARRYSYRVV